jgi:hypothetical protein
MGDMRAVAHPLFVILLIGWNLAFAQSTLVQDERGRAALLQLRQSIGELRNLLDAATADVKSNKNSLQPANLATQQEQDILSKKIDALKRQVQPEKLHSVVFSDEQLASKFKADFVDLYKFFPDDIARLALAKEMQRVEQLQISMGKAPTTWDKFPSIASKMPPKSAGQLFPDNQLRNDILSERKSISKLYVDFEHLKRDLEVISLGQTSAIAPSPRPNLVFCNFLDRVIDEAKVNCPASAAAAALAKAPTPILGNSLLKDAANSARNVVALDLSAKDANARAAPSAGDVAALDLSAKDAPTKSTQMLIQAQLDEERRKLAEERSKLEEEKQAQREQAKLASRISIQAAATKPDADGDFVISIQTSADTASLKVDDDEQGSNKTGLYTIRRVARVGVTNTITISAKDIYGNTDTKTISVARQAVDSRPTFARLNPANINPQPARDAVAIIIGIQNYKLIPKAEYASQDAQVFFDYASRALGIKQENIKLLLDDEADVSGIFKAFQNWLPLKVKKGKTDVYVFYSGHGLPSADGKSLYFLPVGADRDLIAKTAISQKEIVDALKAAQPKSVTMFIDSCYSGQIRTGETLLASARPVVLSVQETAYPPEFTVITASASDQIASSSPDLKHGIFSYYLMKGLEGEADENKDGTITIGKLQSYLAERVPRFAMTMSRKQEPQLTGDANRVLVAR